MSDYFPTFSRCASAIICDVCFTVILRHIWGYRHLIRFVHVTLGDRSCSPVQSTLVAKTQSKSSHLVNGILILTKDPEPTTGEG